VALARSTIDHPAVVSGRGGNWRVVMITDIVGSTAISSNLGDIAYLHLVLEHHDIVRQCLTEWDGHEFSEAGDSLLAWFESTESAVRAAFAVQDAVALRPSGGARLSIRVGLAGGEPLFHDGRPYGLVLNRAARIAATTRDDDVLVDEAVAMDLPSSVHVLFEGRADAERDRPAHGLPDRPCLRASGRGSHAARSVARCSARRAQGLCIRSPP